jgi:hypothetical protein
MHSADNLVLMRRSAILEIGQKLIDRIHWWEEYTARNDQKNNPSRGDKRASNKGAKNIFSVHPCDIRARNQKRVARLWRGGFRALADERGDVTKTRRVL